MKFFLKRKVDITGTNVKIELKVIDLFKIEIDATVLEAGTYLAYTISSLKIEESIWEFFMAMV